MLTDQFLTFVAFFVVAAIALLGALMVATVRNVMHAALALMMSFMGVAGLYVLLEAEFIAAVQVLIYVGAIAVLILFAVMLTRGLMARSTAMANSQWVAGAVVALLLFAALFFIAVGTPWQVSPTTVNTDLIPKIGTELVTTYVLPFEAVSLLLLAALVGAIVIARE